MLLLRRALRRDAVLQHRCAAVKGLFLTVATAAARRDGCTEESEPARGWGVGDSEGEEGVATVFILRGEEISNYHQKKKKRIKGLLHSQRIFITAAKPVAALGSHIRRQVQRRQIEPAIAALGDEQLPAVELPRIVAGYAEHAVDGVVWVVAIEVGPENGLAALRIAKQRRVKQRRDVGEGEVVRVEKEHLVKGAAQDGLGFEFEVLPLAGGFVL